MKRMAQLTRDYHKNLQNKGLSNTNNHEEHKNKTNTFLQNIPREQTVQDCEASPMNWAVKREQVRDAIIAAKNGSATGMDGCLYELWKKLVNEHDIQTKKNKPSFDIIQTLMEVLQDIHMNGIDTHTNFTLG